MEAIEAPNSLLGLFSPVGEFALLSPFDCVPEGPGQPDAGAPVAGGTSSSRSDEAEGREDAIGLALRNESEASARLSTRQADGASSDGDAQPARAWGEEQSPFDAGLFGVVSAASLFADPPVLPASPDKSSEGSPPGGDGGAGRSSDQGPLAHGAPAQSSGLDASAAESSASSPSFADRNLAEAAAWQTPRLGPNGGQGDQAQHPASGSGDGLPEGGPGAGYAKGGTPAAKSPTAGSGQGGGGGGTEGTFGPSSSPEAVDDSYGVVHDQTLEVPVSGVQDNDVFPGGGASAVLVTPAQHGTLWLRPNGSFDYTPDLHYVGDDSFSYYLTDGTTTSNTATVTLTVTNEAPVGAAEGYGVLQGGTLTVGGGGVLANDRDPDYDLLTAAVVTGPGHGTLALNSDGTFTYTPAPTYSGADFFVYAPNDGVASGAPVTVALNVHSTNQAPATQADSYSILHDSTLAVARGVLANDADADGDLLRAVLVSAPDSGSLTLNADGSFKYTPAAGYTGADFFTYKSNDGTADGNTVTVSLTVTDAAPVGVAESYTVPHGQPWTADVNSGVLANDTDADGDVLTAVLVSGPTSGALTLNADGSFTYTPEAGHTGAASFEYAPHDGALSGSPVTVTLTVTDGAPTAVADSYGVVQGAPRTVGGRGVLGNDTDPGGDALTATVVSMPENGSLTLNADGTFTYTAAPGHSGTDSFTYQASDGAMSATATVTLTTHAANAAPAGAADSYSGPHDVPLVVGAPGVLANDTDADGDPLKALLVEAPATGTLTLDPDGSFVYVPADGQTGTVTFTYQATDGVLTSAVVTVTLTLTNANAPAAAADAYAVGRNGELYVGAPGVLGNDTDADGDALTATLVSGPPNGTVTLNADGSFLYTPAAGFLGTDHFTYRAGDGVLTSAATTVTVQVTNSAPTAVADAFRVVRDDALQVPAGVLLGNDYDPEGDPLTASLVDGPGHGSLALNADGSFTYTPTLGYAGRDSFTYQVSDGLLASVPVGVVLTVRAGNAAPTAGADAYAVGHGQVLDVAADEGLLANDGDADGNPLWVTLVTGPLHGGLALRPDGSFTYTPAAAYSGPDFFTYRLSDGSAAVDATVTLTVTDAAPVAAADRFSVKAAGTTVVDALAGVLANDADPEDDLTAVLVSGPANGTLALNPDGSFSYTPGAGFSGQDTFTYRAVGGAQQSAVATVTLVAGPVAYGDAYTVQHDTDLVLDADAGVLANDDAADGGTLVAVLVTPPDYGTLTLNGDGSLVYRPAAGYVGEAFFSYRVTVGAQTSVPVNVTVSVQNQAPTAADAFYDVRAGQALSVGGLGLGEGATDPDLDDTLRFVLDQGPRHGRLVRFRPDGTFDYQPDPGFVGVDTFTYHTHDGAASSPTLGEVTVAVRNQAPVVADSAFEVAKGGSLPASPARNVLDGASDPDGDALTVTLVSGPTHASSFTLNADGTFAYTPQADHEGEDEFTFTVSDGTGASAPAKAKVKVRPTAVAHDDVYWVPASGAWTVSAADGVLGNDVAHAIGVDGTTVFAAPQHGVLQLNTDGSFTYTPGAGNPTTDEFLYRVALFDEAGVEHNALGKVTLVFPTGRPKLTLKAVQFLNPNPAEESGVFRVLRDKTGKAYPTGWTAADKDAVNPVAMPLNTPFNVRVTVGVQGNPLLLPTAHAVGAPALRMQLDPGLGWEGLDEVKPPVKGAITASTKEISAAWEGVKIKNQGAALTLDEGADTRWWVVFPDGNAGTAGLGGLFDPAVLADGTSHHRFYVLIDQPSVGKGGLRHTVVQLGSKALVDALKADGTLTGNALKDKVVQNLTTAFTTKVPYRRPVVLRADDGEPLKYYGDWRAAVNGWNTTAKLLTQADGMCEAWSRFFLDVLKVQGVKVGKAVVTVAPKGGVRYRMYVKNWSPDEKASNAPADAPAGYIYKNTYEIPKKWDLRDLRNPYLENLKDQAYRWKLEKVKKRDGVPGQSQNNPLAIFGTHVITQVTFGGKTYLFDPSYGKLFVGGENTPQSRLLSFQKGSLDFIGLHLPDDTLRKWDVLFLPVTKDTALQLVGIYRS